MVATITGETVSPQTVSKLTRDLDEAVRQFHQAQLTDDYVYLFLDGVSLQVRRPRGRKRVQMLVAYGIRRDGSRHLLAFRRSQGEGQAVKQSPTTDACITRLTRFYVARSLNPIFMLGGAPEAHEVLSKTPRVNFLLNPKCLARGVSDQG